MIDALKSWNPWWGTGKVPDSLKGKPRAMLSEAIKWIPEKQVKVFLGPRRAGKSTIMYQLVDYILKSAKPEEILFVNFQDPSIVKEDLEEILISHKREFNPKKTFIFLDEAQEKEGWELWIKSKYDQNKDINFFVSGSSSTLLRKKFSHYLTGRVKTFYVYPLVMQEFLGFAGFDAKEPFDKEESATFEYHINQFLLHGSFPEVFLKEEEKKLPLLIEYVEDTIAKDIVSRYNANYEVAKQLLEYYASNSGALTSVNRMEKTMGLSAETITKYTEYFKETMILIEAKHFSYSLSKQQKSQRKFYIIDNGILNSIAFSFSKNEGKLLENAVAQEIVKKGFSPYYYEGEASIDFVVKTQKGLNLYQVSTDPSIKRETAFIDVRLKLKNVNEKKIISLRRCDSCVLPHIFLTESSR